MKNSLMFFLIFIFGVLAGVYLAPQGEVVLHDYNEQYSNESDVSRDYEAELKRIMQRLAESDAAVKYLQGLNASLSSLINGQQLQISSLLSSPGVKKKIASMNESELTEKLSVMFREGDLNQIPDKRQFANRLLEIALGDNENIDTSSLNASIAISTAPEYISASSPVLNIKQYDKLYAHLTVSSNPGKALVKWTDLTSGKILKLKRIGFSPDELNHYVSMRPKGGWYKGDFQVNLYKVDQGLSLLASNIYTLQTVEENERPERSSEPVEHIEGVSAGKVKNSAPRSSFGLF